MSKLWNRSIVTKDGKTIELQAQHQFGSGDTLADLEDVDINNPQIGQIIKWNGEKWVNANESGGGGYTLPVATSEVLGGVKVGSNLSINENGVLSAPAPTPQYTLPKASSETLGGIKVGSNLSIQEDGTLNASSGSQYVLPVASANTLGGIKVGSNLSIDENGVLSASSGGGGLTIGTHEFDSTISTTDSPVTINNAIQEVFSNLLQYLTTKNSSYHWQLGGISFGRDITLNSNIYYSRAANFILNNKIFDYDAFSKSIVYIDGITAANQISGAAVSKLQYSGTFTSDSFTFTGNVYGAITSSTEMPNGYKLRLEINEFVG